MASEPEREARELRRLGALALVLASAWLIVVTYVAHSALPPNPIALPFESRVGVRFWARQGWALFTKDPKQEDMSYFVRTRDGGWVSASLGPHSSPSNAFGLNRASRAQSAEADLLFIRLAQGAWHPCQEDPASCLESAPVSASLKNPSPAPTLCGPVGIVLQVPVPWATWRESRSPVTMPSRVTRLEVEC
jgi:antimicrobial peptide system SdpA family protein